MRTTLKGRSSSSMAGLQKGVLRTFSEHLSRDPASAEIASLQPFDTISVLYNPKGGAVMLGKTLGCAAFLSLAAASDCLAQAAGENCVLLYTAPVTWPLCGQMSGRVQAGTTVIARQTKSCWTNRGQRRFTWIGTGDYAFSSIGWVPTEYLGPSSFGRRCP